MAKTSRSIRSENPTISDRLAEAIERLTGELRIMSDILECLREDFSWVTRNGLPVQPVEHVIVKRMAKDPLAADWSEQLETVHVQTAPPSTLNLNEDAIQKLADGLTAAFDGIAQGQLEIVLTALDGVRAETLAIIGKHTGPAQPPSTSSKESEPNATPQAPHPKPGRPPRNSLF